MQVTQEHIATIWKDTPQTYGPSGADVELLAFLPRAAADIPIGSYESLQRTYNGKLDIEVEKGRVTIGRKFLAYARADVGREIAAFRRSISQHLSLETAL